MRAMHLVLENFTVVDTVQMQSQGNIHSVWGLRVWSKSMWMEPHANVYRTSRDEHFAESFGVS